jgi:sRNA-binding protein
MIAILIASMGILAWANGNESMENLPDPTQPYRATKAHAETTMSSVKAPRRLVVTSVIKDDQAVAMINGRRVHVGERIDDALITEIETRGVHVRRPSGVEFIPVFSLATRAAAIKSESHE